ncbi:MAG: PKD domain-containing protein, partial [Chloroflexota bacterium]
HLEAPRAGEPVLLYGRATDREDGAITALTWTVDGEYAGDKQTLQIGALPPGTYQIALVATDSAGQSARATHTLIVAP